MINCNSNYHSQVIYSSERTEDDRKNQNKTSEDISYATDSTWESLRKIENQLGLNLFRPSGATYVEDQNKKRRKK